MQSKGKTSHISLWAKLSWKSVLVILFLFTLFIRFPFFFRDYIDRDESTFILVGQALVDGHLPYTFLWDLKPPVVFFIMAGLIAIFGKSFIAIRFFGVLAVSLTAFFTYEAGVRVFSKKIGLWASLGTVLLLSLFGSMQGVMSEHISMLFFMPGIVLLLDSRKNRCLFYSGLCMGLALMTKINLAYPVLFIAIFLFMEGIGDGNWKEGLRRSVLFGIACLIVILLTVLPYFLENNAILWWRSVVLAPLKYTSAEPFSPQKIWPFVLLISAFFLYAWKKGRIDFKSARIQLLTVALLGVCISFVKGGKVNGHYLIQLYPVLLLFVGAVLSSFRILTARYWGPVLIILLLVIPVESYKEYYAIFKYKKERGSYYNGEGIWVPQYLQQEGLDTHGVFFLEYHIGYWLLGQYPPTPAATHPSNLCRDELFPFFDNPRHSSLEELKYIMEGLSPRMVVVRKNKRIFDKKQVLANAYLNEFIKDHYVLYKSLDAAEIYLRLDLH